MYLTATASQLDQLLQPETALEREILSDEQFREGLLWGKPRYGHPEGQIVFHILDIFDNIERLSIDADTRRKLRLITLVHDTFKAFEHRGKPRDWERHHSKLAYQYLQRFCNEHDVLTVTELHDEAYYCWRLVKLYNEPEKGDDRLRRLLERIDGFRQLYYLFFKCDTRTGDKTQAPVFWFEQTVTGIEIVGL